MKYFVVFLLVIIFGILGCEYCGSGGLKISESALNKDGTLDIVWNSKEGVKYEVLSCDDPKTPEEDWKVEATVTGGQGKKTSWKDTQATSDKRKLYKIRQVDVPE